MRAAWKKDPFGLVFFCLFLFFLLSVILAVNDWDYFMHGEQPKENRKNPHIRTFKGGIGEIPMDTIVVPKYKFESWCPLVEKRPNPKKIN